MKKTLLAAAVASTVTSFAMADISITGDAKFEYDYHDTGSATSNTANTEMHINVVGKQGDTSVVIKTEIDTHGDGNQLDIEDNYSTTGLLGELEEGGRVTNKVTLGYKVGGIDFYAGNSGISASTRVAADEEGDVKINNNMFAGAKFQVAGQNVEVKKNSDTRDSFGINGSVSGINYRYEAMDDETNGDASFLQLSTKLSGITVEYAAIDADAHALVTETDSSVFAQEIGASTTASTAKEQQQVMVSTSVDGTTLKAQSGTIKAGNSDGTDMDYVALSASRPLASGATLVVSYNDKDTSSSASTENLEVELNVKF
jgi:hypothetical protein